MSTHPVDVGTRTEAAILSRLVDLGYRVLLPFGFNQRYDLVLDLEGEFRRVQCKTGRLRNGAVVFRAASVRSNTRATHSKPYFGEVELFAVYCPENGSVYVVPADETMRTIVHLRVAPAVNSQERRIRWARDYELADAREQEPERGLEPLA